MADNTTIACTDVGNSLSNPICCTANNLGSGACNAIFAPDRILDHGCKFRNCVDTCSDPRLLYVSHVQINGTGNGIDPIQRYAACVNVPTISQAMKQGALTGTNAVAAQRYLGRNATEDDLRKITSAVTECLSSTCRVSRGKDDCYNEFCSPVKLLTDPSTPNIRGINNCINKLCSSSYEALPYADADVVGVGVYTSYVLQCAFLVIIWIGLFIIAVSHKWRIVSSKRREAQDKSKPQHPPQSRQNFITRLFRADLWIDLLLEFHKTQCYFSGTLMIASFAESIYTTDLLVGYMLIPLAINGILPISFAYMLLVYFWKTSVGITLLTVTVYTLASVVYWTLYAHIIPVTSGELSYRSYEQFMYKLSAIPACGGFSALAACPRQVGLMSGPIGNGLVGTRPIKEVGRKLRVLTPIIWTFSTAVLLVLLALQLRQWRVARAQRRLQSSQPTEEAQLEEAQSREAKLSDAETHENSKAGPAVAVGSRERKGGVWSPKVWRVLFWLCTICFFVGMGMQLSLLAVFTELQMMDPTDWGFGQIVAVTIWLPPALEYLYKLFRGKEDSTNNQHTKPGKHSEASTTEKQ